MRIGMVRKLSLSKQHRIKSATFSEKSKDGNFIQDNRQDGFSQNDLVKYGEEADSCDI